MARGAHGVGCPDGSSYTASRRPAGRAPTIRATTQAVAAAVVAADGGCRHVVGVLVLRRLRPPRRVWCSHRTRSAQWAGAGCSGPSPPSGVSSIQDTSSPLSQVWIVGTARSRRRVRHLHRQAELHELVVGQPGHPPRSRRPGPASSTVASQRGGMGCGPTRRRRASDSSFTVPVSSSQPWGTTRAKVTNPPAGASSTVGSMWAHAGVASPTSRTPARASTVNS